MVGKLVRGTVIFILATLIVVYIVTGTNRPPAPKLPPDTILGYLSV